jgi:hypothetical protein
LSNPAIPIGGGFARAFVVVAVSAAAAVAAPAAALIVDRGHTRSGGEEPQSNGSPSLAGLSRTGEVIMKHPILILLAVAALAGGARVSAEVFQITPSDNLQTAVNALGPGDILLLDSGHYLLTSRFSIQKTGTANALLVFSVRTIEETS